MIVKFIGIIYNTFLLKKIYNINYDITIELLLQELYTKIGFYNMIQQLEGSFAISIQKPVFLYLARDRMGICPLYKNRDFVSFIEKEGYTLLKPCCLRINLIHRMLGFIKYDYKKPTYQTFSTPKLYFIKLFDKVIKKIFYKLNNKFAHIIRNNVSSNIILNALNVNNIKVHITEKYEDNYIYIMDYGFERLFTEDDYSDNWLNTGTNILLPFLDISIVDLFLTTEHSERRNII